MAALLPLFRYAAGAASVVADGELLGRFADGRDEAAFAELVRRHGPVVFRVCRRLVGPDAAEDAFQAAFLVLATRPDAARAAGSVAGWLVGVAGRVARQMRRAAGRRARHESAAARCDEQHDPPDLTDQFRALDEEIARLPDRLRDPIVLCLLRGLTQDEAAAELGRDARTLRRRLARAKEVLRARLERRGVVPVVAAALASGAGAVTAAVPGALAARTVAVVFDFLTGGAGAARSMPVVVAKGVAMTMLTRKLTHVVAALAAGLIGLGAVLAGDKPLPAPPEGARKAPAAPPAPPVMPQEAAPQDHLDWAKNEARRNAIVAAGSPAGAEPSILIDALCIKVPSAFCERCGLEETPGGAGVWNLSPRETRMFTALLRAEPGKEVVSRPQMMVADKQAGLFQVGQEVPYTVVEPPKPGVAFPVTKVEYKSVGVTLRVAPRIAADGRSILLRSEAESTQVGPPVDLGNGTTAPVFNTQSNQTTVLVPDAGTVVLRTGTTTTGTVLQLPDGTKKAGKKEMIDELWVLTAHIVRPAGKKPAAAPKPAPGVPLPTPAAQPPAPVKP